MTRYVVFRENTEPLPHTFVVMGSLKPPENRDWLPVTYGFDMLQEPVGRARNFERDETGAISFDIEFHNSLDEKDIKEECFSLAIRDMVTSDDQGVKYVTEGTIWYLAYIPLPGFPKAKSSQELQGS